MISNYRYKTLGYYVATFVATYALWFAGAYLSFRDDKGLYMLLMLPGLMAPFLISLYMIYTSGNAHLKTDFVNRLINPRLIRAKMLPFFFLLMPAAVLVSIAISLPFGGSIEQFRLSEGFSFSMGAVPVLMILLMAAAFEELGWRGYAFDSLQSRYTLFTASVVFGVLWSLWHFPLLFVKNSYHYEILHQNVWFAVNFYVGIIPMGVIISWICVKNRKSVLAAILFHFIINISQEALAMTQVTKCIESGVLTVVAVAIIMLDKELFFSKKHIAFEAKK
ncbi:MAG TPA: CPBP family intramembrane metalloprotease [Spirochaetes bacterium]|nr:CPBP family intramembrane metalloprotease [Spirochaetota bacterium]